MMRRDGHNKVLPLSGGAVERSETERVGDGEAGAPASGNNLRNLLSQASPASSPCKGEHKKERDTHTLNAIFGRKISLRAKCLIAGIFLAVFVVSYFIGTYTIWEGYTPAQIIEGTWNHFFNHSVFYPETAVSAQAATEAATLDHILFGQRLPRILLVLLVGAALSCAGASFQGMFKNPLVSPDLLGASAGASLGACLAILLDASQVWVQVGAFVGGLVAVSLTVWLRNIIKSDAILGLVLAGMLVSTLFQSGMSYVKLVADTNNKLPNITYWLMGSFHGANFADLSLAVFPMLVGFVLMLTQTWKLNVMSFGDDEARAMGVNTTRTRLIVILGATLVTSTSVAVAGVIGWVGLVIPHFARAVVGPNYKKLLVTCLLLGSAYLLLIDDIARIAGGGAEIPIGILTSILGVPFFLVIFRRTSKGW